MLQYISIQNILIITAYSILLIFLIFLYVRKRKFAKSYSRKKNIITSAIIFSVLTTVSLYLGGSIGFFCFLDGPYVGQILDAETGEPVSNANVVSKWDIYKIYSLIDWHETADLSETTSNEDGKFVIPVSITFDYWPWPFSYISHDFVYIYKTGYLSHPKPQIPTVKLYGYMPGRCISPLVHHLKYLVEWNKFDKNIVRLTKARSLEERFQSTLKLDDLNHNDEDENIQFAHKILNTLSQLQRDKDKLPSAKDFKREYEQLEMQLKESPVERFIEQDDVVVDTCTGLIWTKKDSGESVNWSEGKDYCINLGGEDNSPWRLPTIAELETLYDGRFDNKAKPSKSDPRANRSSCEMNTVFEMTGCWIWASDLKYTESANLNFSSLRWYYINPGTKNWSTRVLCVRDWDEFAGERIQESFNAPYAIYPWD